eukprot:Lithocolla_globosa_v1_NODE_1860_length_2291_cov_7.607335.p2 type:complete len:241 gc:universal NODE_1860_length_2291_cov_7.607335:783-61(-)
MNLLFLLFFGLVWCVFEDEDLRDGVQHALTAISLENQQLREQQFAALRCFFKPDGSVGDVFVQLPCGYERIFEVLPFVADYMMPEITGPWLVLVISPLQSLMISQVAKLNQMGISAIYLGDKMTHEELEIAKRGILNGEYRFVYSSPESLLNSSFWVDVLRSPLFQRRLLCFVVDEAHCIVTWGDDFRMEYSQLVKVRAYVPHVPIMAFTATASIRTREAICKSLRIENGLQMIVQVSFF